MVQGARMTLAPQFNCCCSFFTLAGVSEFLQTCPHAEEIHWLFTRAQQFFTLCLTPY